MVTDCCWLYNDGVIQAVTFTYRIYTNAFLGVLCHTQILSSIDDLCISLMQAPVGQPQVTMVSQQQQQQQQPMQPAQTYPARTCFYHA